MLALKLGLVALSVLLASLAARRWGHGVAGTLSGFPVIAAPITLFVLWQQHEVRTREIALATLVCLPATVVHLMTFAAVIRAGGRWAVALVAANGAFLATGGLLVATAWPAAATLALAAGSLVAGAVVLRGMVRQALAARGPLEPPAGSARTPAVPRVELGLRIAAAVAVAAAVMMAAESLPAWASGLLLAVPITGNVLPCFTAPRYGPVAVLALLAGFVQGLFGFATFFVVLYVALARVPAGVSALLALAAAVVAARVSYRYWSRPAGRPLAGRAP